MPGSPPHLRGKPKASRKVNAPSGITPAPAGKTKLLQRIYGGEGDDRDTLANEYYRDEVRGLNPELPENYFPDDDRRAIPHFMWRSHANLLFQNWLNYYVYQQTPFDLKDLITLEKPQKKS